MSGSIFDDDDGNPGAARYYGSAGKISEMYENLIMAIKQLMKNIKKKRKSY